MGQVPAFHKSDLGGDKTSKGITKKESLQTGTFAIVKNMPNLPKKPSLMANAFSNWIALVTNVLIGFVLTPYIIHHINKTGYGLWTLVGSLIGYFGVMRMGIGAGLMRYIPYYTGRRDNQGVIGCFSTATVYFLVVGLMIFATTYFAADSISAFFKAGDEFKTLIKLFGAAASLGCISILVDAVLRAREKFVTANYIQISAALLRGAGIAAVLYLGYGLVQMGIVVLAREIFVLICGLIALGRTCADIRFSLKGIRLRYFRELVWFGVMALLTTLGFLLKFESDKMIVGRMMNIESVGIYSVAAMLMLYYRNFLGAGSRVLRPRFAFLDGNTSKGESVRLFLLATRANAWLAALGIIIIAVIGPSFISLWVGTGFERAYTILLILAFGHLFDQSQTASVALLGGYGKQGVLACFMIGEGFAACTLGVALCRVWGLNGVAIGFVAAPLISQAIIRPAYVCRYFGIRLWQYYKSCLIKPWLLASAPLIYMLMFATRLDIFHSWCLVILTGFSVVAMYSFVSYVFLLDRDERSSVKLKISHYFTEVYRKIPRAGLG